MGSILPEVSLAPPASASAPPYRGLEVFVLFTGIEGTQSALRTATQLAQGLTARICVLLVEAVPFPRAITSPQRDIRFLRRQFSTLTDRCGADASSRSVEVVAQILLCRDPWQALKEKLPANSVVVIGTRGRWWPRPEDRLARKLRAAGHHVVRTPAAMARRGLQFNWRISANA